MKLKKVLSMKLGLNLSRQKDKEDIPIYTNKDMLDDLEQIEVDKPEEAIIPFEDGTHTVHSGDVVYNDGKSINQNFAKIIFDDKHIDSKFICYLLNESSEIEKQKFISLQGSIIKKLSPSVIYEFDVRLPDLEQQQLIGNLYFDWLKRQALIKKEQELEDKMMKEMLNKLTIMEK